VVVKKSLSSAELLEAVGIVASESAAQAEAKERALAVTATRQSSVVVVEAAAVVKPAEAAVAAK
jgi:hypothetical protein